MTKSHDDPNSMTTPSERVSHLDLLARLKSSFSDLPDAPYPDLIDHERFAAYVKTPHDVGGEPDASIKFQNKEYEAWEHNTYVSCEVLGWRGIWLSEERRRMGNVDVGRTIYLGLPYYGRWVLAAARILVEKHHITLAELTDRLAEVKARYEGGLDGKDLEARPKSEGDGAGVERNLHHTHAVGKGDPQVYSGRAGEAKFRVGDKVRVRDLPALFYTRTRSSCAAPKARSPPSRTKAWRPRMRPGTDMTRGRSGSTSFGSTSPNCGMAIPGTKSDTLQTELPERWLEAVA